VLKIIKEKYYCYTGTANASANVSRYVSATNRTVKKEVIFHSDKNKNHLGNMSTKSEAI
jgi:hypothetical protein